MSYDLNFYKKCTDSIAKEEIAAYLTQLPHVTYNGETEWFYENEQTGVYCSFDYYEPSSDDEEYEDEYDEEERERLKGFESTGFSFNINYIRPQFFGIECFPIVDKFVEDLGLYISNPQELGTPEKYEPGVLGQQWAETNLKFSGFNAEKAGLHYLDRDKSNASWEFCYKRLALQYILGEEYFVPGIYYIKPFDSEEIKTLCVWPEHIPVALPEVDYVLIQKKIKKLFKEKTEEGIIAYSELKSRLGQYFTQGKSYMLLDPDAASNIGRDYNKLPLMGGISEFGEGFPVERITNAQVEQVAA